MYECLCGYPPFYADEPVQTCKKITNWRDTFIIPPEVEARLSKSCVAFLHGMVCDAKDRLGRESVDDIKNHPWFKGVDWVHCCTLWIQGGK